MSKAYQPKLAPELLLRQKRVNRKPAQKVNQNAIAELIPQLQSAGYSRVAKWLTWQGRADSESKDAKLGVRACRLLLQGEFDTAKAILDSLIGIWQAPEESGLQLKSQPSPMAIQVRPWVLLDYQPVTENKLIAMIGTGHPK